MTSTLEAPLTQSNEMALGTQESQELVPPTTTLPIETSDGFTAKMDIWQLGNHDVIRVTPDKIRTDQNTGEPALPLVVALGLNSDSRIHWALTAFAQDYEGPTVGIFYRQPEGSARLARTEGFPNPAPKLVFNKANDLLEGLELIGIKRARAVTESGGNFPVEIVAAKRPDLFEQRRHDAAVGHDGTRYFGTHMSALRIGWDNLRQRRKRKIDPLVYELASLAIPAEVPRHSLRARRRAQKSVARAHHARLNEIAAATQYAPDQSVTFVGHQGDRGIKPHRLRRNIAPIQATGNGVTYVDSNWGAHAWGKQREPIRAASQHFKNPPASPK